MFRAAKTKKTQNLAKTALTAIASPDEVGEFVEVREHEQRTVTLLFTCLKKGYSGWFWAVSVTQVADGETVTVDEIGMLPGDDAILAPAWVPWSERLAQFKEQRVKNTAANPAADTENAALTDADSESIEDELDDDEDTLDIDDPADLTDLDLIERALDRVAEQLAAET